MLEDSALRKQDFKNLFKKISSLPYNKYCNMKTLLIKTIMSTAPGYYITYEYARRLLRLFRRNLLPKSYNPLRYMMIAEIAQRVDAIKQSPAAHAEGRALARVLAQGNASRFFISLPTAMRLIHNS